MQEELQSCRKPYLWEKVRNVFRFPTFSQPKEVYVLPPIKRGEPHSKVKVYPGILFIQQGPL